MSDLDAWLLEGDNGSDDGGSDDHAVPALLSSARGGKSQHVTKLSKSHSMLVGSDRKLITSPKLNMQSIGEENSDED